jgi:extracellular factor (EF) 3-hydroxypalmitic acid methyl ester biosynthesis protein
MVEAGAATICQATLACALTDVDLSVLNSPAKVLPPAFRAFLQRWQKYYKVSAEYKLAVADMHSFLHEFRLWMDQIELNLRGVPAGRRPGVERAIVRELPATQALDAVFERFEAAAGSVREDLLPAHRAYCRRQLHPLLLCAPFMHRIFAKPLGYAGDYEMMNMIFRNDCEGGSLFAKLLQDYILDQAPARAVRNRADYFTHRLLEESLRVTVRGRTASFCSLGCGPAWEVEAFLSEYHIADKTQFHLLDFNAETLNYTSQRLADIKTRYGRSTQIKFTKKSVQFLLKDPGKPLDGVDGYDLIYCSGLYDYLSDRVCRSLNSYLYRLLRPGGVLIVNNFDPYNPIRNLMEHAFDWFLIHRNHDQLAALAPPEASPEDWLVCAEPTGTTIFLEVRKPC